MAYVVGLLATDGCLISRGRRHISFDSGDAQLVETFLACLGRPRHYSACKTRSNGVRFKAQFSDVRFYRWLESVGLTPRKSLTLGAIAVPDGYLLPLIRGLLDGDGTIYVVKHHPTPKTYPNYTYERLWTRFTSASRPHLVWLRDRLRALTTLDGYLRQEPLRPGRHPFFTLKYGNRASTRLLPLLYPAGAPCLERKRAIWLDYASRHALLR